MTHHPKRGVGVLVVDDQLGERQSVYAKCLEKVQSVLAGKWGMDIRYCPDLGAIACMDASAYDQRLAILDMVLDGPNWPKSAVEQLDRTLAQQQWPLLLVSARFGANQAIDRANQLLEGGPQSKALPFQFVLWSSIERIADGEAPGELAFIVDAILSRSYDQNLSFRKAPDEEIGILHVTDPHFGKADWNVGRLMSLRVARDKLGLRHSDFLAVTGDVADRGAPSQYSSATQYFQALVNNGLLRGRSEGGLAQDRVLICPGNHDFSRPIALGANLLGASSYEISKDMQADHAWVRDFAWKPYEDFEQSIAGVRDRWVPTPGYRVNSRFSSAGVIFLELNVERYSIDGYQAGTSEKEVLSCLNHAATAVASARKPGQCLVVLAHRHMSDGWSALAQSVGATLRGFAADGPVVLLCGHDHDAKVGGEFDETVLLVRGIPPIPGPARPPEVLPVVHMISLLRSGGVVVGASVQQFHQQSATWLMPEGKRYAWTGRAWSVAP